MKRVIILLLLLFSVTSPFLFADYLPDQVKTIPIRGLIDSYCTVHVSAINSTTVDSTEGLPFDLTSSTVRYNAAYLNNGRLINGRVVAIWTLATNSTTKTLNVKATPFTHEDSVSVINYYLALILDYKDGNGVEQTDYLTVNTETDLNGKTFTISSTAPVISENQNILLMFSQNYNMDDLPNGYYEAEVQFTLTGV